MMNRVVHEHLKASELPEKLRAGIDASAMVTVTVQEEADPAPSRATLQRLLKEAQNKARGTTADEAVERIRALRDEWDD